jgi:hypothetical protein
MQTSKGRACPALSAQPAQTAAHLTAEHRYVGWSSSLLK